MSKAVVFDHYGPPDVLRLVEMPLAVLQPGQVRIRVQSAGVQPFDALFRSGTAHRWVRQRSRNGSGMNGQARLTSLRPMSQVSQSGKGYLDGLCLPHMRSMS